MSRIVTLAALFTLSSHLPAFAAATTPCGDRAALVDRLGQHYAETPVVIGLDSQGRMLEVLAAGSGGTWTVLVTSPSTGQTCLVASGTAFEMAMPVTAIGDPA